MTPTQQQPQTKQQNNPKITRQGPKSLKMIPKSKISKCQKKNLTKLNLSAFRSKAPKVLLIPSQAQPDGAQKGSNWPPKQNKSKSQKTKKNQFKWVNPKKLLRPYPNPYNSLTRPQKAQNDPKKQKKSENQKSYKMKVISHKKSVKLISRWS